MSDKIEAICTEDYYPEHAQYFPWKKGDKVYISYQPIEKGTMFVDGKEILYYHFQKHFKLL